MCEGNYNVDFVPDETPNSDFQITVLYDWSFHTCLKVWKDFSVLKLLAKLISYYPILQ